MDIEEKTETFVYDVGNFLTAAGGNLGLFMGFSCLSIILTFIDKFEHHFSWKFCKESLENMCLKRLVSWFTFFY